MFGCVLSSIQGFCEIGRLTFFCFITLLVFVLPYSNCFRTLCSNGILSSLPTLLAPQLLSFYTLHPWLSSMFFITMFYVYNVHVIHAQLFIIFCSQEFTHRKVGNKPRHALRGSLSRVGPRGSN